MAAVATKPVDRELRKAQEQIIRWRKGGPALFAVEALGMPAKYDPVRRTGVLKWWWEASEKLVRRKRLSIRSGHGVTKSAFLSITILWFTSCFFPTKIPCTAPTAHQLSDVLWAELAKWHRLLRDRFPDLAEQFEQTQDEYRMRAAPKESFAVARTARADKPEALQGFHSENLMILADEASGIPDVIFEVGQGALSSEGSYAILAANPTRKSGFFYETHHRLRSRWETMVVNAEDIRDETSGQIVTQQMIDDIAHQYGADSNIYKVRVLGEFASEADDVVIPLDLCETAKIREVEAYGDVVWGVDVARFGRDRTTLVKRRSNASIAKHLAWQGQDLMQTAGRIYAEWLETKPEDRPKSIFVDVIGIGAGLADRLMELGLPIVPVNVAEEASVDDKYLRLRDELWFKARKWLERKDCKLFDDEVLIAELTLPRYGFTSTGKLKVESKDELKKRYPQSPDVADAFCLTFSQTAEHRGRQAYEPEWYADV